MLILNAQYNSWRGCALSVAMPQALRLTSTSLQLLERLRPKRSYAAGFTTPLSTSAPCPIPLNPLQWICDVSLEIDIPAEWLRRSFHCL
ncbi:hypothetical protein [Nostoc sp.]|uniref:hypothetical protein n=1 Tax=Nostoc sp. TaxID=1180 RepID=UPI002FF88AF5